MSLSEYTIKKPVFSWMVILAVVMLGMLSYRRLGISQMPDVDHPVLDISVEWEGASPEVVETDIVDVVEDGIMGIEGLRQISSSARQGQGSVTLEFELGRDIDAAFQETQSKLSELQRRLPEGIDPPVIRKSNPEDQPIIIVGVSSSGTVTELMKYVDLNLKDQFKVISGVGEVSLNGFIDPSLRVWVDPLKLKEFELTIDDIKESILREHMEKPAGEVETPEKETRVRVMGEADTVAEFERMMINTRGGQPLYRPIALKEVAAVEDGLADIRRISRINGNRSVGIAIRKQRGANSVAIGHAIRALVEDLQGRMPAGYEIDINFDTTEFVEDSINELLFSMVLSAVLTGLICWLFLGSLSSTLNIVMGIPFSIFGAFCYTYFTGYTLNTFTLMGLTLAIGIVVDDAIMILENIVRHREMKKGLKEAALDGSKEITPAAVAATTAVMAVFLPVFFMEGVIGKFFFQFGAIISVALLFSLFEALAFAPMRCAQFLEVGERRSWIGRLFEWLMKATTTAYGVLLEWSLRGRWLVLILAAAFFGSSLLVIPKLRREFLPPQDQSAFIGRLKAPVGSSLQYTNTRFLELEKFLQSRPEVRRYMVAVGGFGAGGRSNEGNVFISMRKPKERPVDPKTGKPLTQQEFMGVMRDWMKTFPGMRGSFQDLSTRGFVAQRGFPVEFTVRGPEWEDLVKYSHGISERMGQDAFFTDVDTDYVEGMPEIRVLPDRDKAFQRGVSVNSIASTVNALIAGEVVSKYTSHGRRYDVRIRVRPEQRTGMKDIGALQVRNNRGELVRLTDVVDMEERKSLLGITRRDRERAITLYANVAAGKSQADALEAAEKIAAEILPAGYRIVFSGTSQAFQESFSSLLMALWMGVIIAYMVLASQYNHLLHPFTVLLAIPFSASGALLALWWTNQSLNIFSMIGLLLLIGIVKKNSILLVDFTNQLREEGLSAREALKQACPIRLRPVLMTSVSTLAAALPPALALGPGAETRIPMAIAVIGGVAVSTVLTLFVVPAAYLLLVPLETLFRRNKKAAAAEK